VDTSILMDAIRVAGLGMALVFLALSALLLSIYLLGRFFPEKEAPVATGDQVARPLSTTNAAARAAAIGLALALHSRTTRAPITATAARPTEGSGWLDQGRRHQMARRQDL
jgi:Na+-transporting methylmalonyl-CoA/oxaloacetate decarboxylase gamma subunit